MPLESTRDIIAGCIPGAVSEAGSDYIFSGVCSRVADIRGGELFVSVESDVGAEQAAFARGAALLLTTNHPQLLSDTIDSDRVLQVPDVGEALWAIAKWWLSVRSVPLLVVTGGPGKTITKEFISRILINRGLGCCTRGSRNNALDAAETLCQLGENDSWCVLECTPDSLAALAAHAITAESVLHIATASGCDSGLEKILPGSTAANMTVLPYEQAMAATESVITYGEAEAATVSVKDIQIVSLRATSFTIASPTGAVDVTMTLPGRHIARNAAAAVAGVYSLFPEIPLEEMVEPLRFMHPLPGRLLVHRLPENRYVFDDTQHATVHSVQPLLDLGYECVAAHAALACILGPLDEGGLAEHREYTEQLCQLKPVALIVLGKFADPMLEVARAHGVPAMKAVSPQAAAHTALKFPFSVLFVKGGNTLKLDAAVSTILEAVGEVLEIPDGLTHFSAGQTKEE